MDVEGERLLDGGFNIRMNLLLHAQNAVSKISVVAESSYIENFSFYRENGFGFVETGDINNGNGKYASVENAIAGQYKIKLDSNKQEPVNLYILNGRR